MSDKAIADKLLIKEGYSVLLVNPPKGYRKMLGPLPKGATLLKAPTRPADLIQVFVANRHELESQLPVLKPARAPNGLFWVTYLKGSAKTKTDINRDTINAYARTVGLRGVAMISIDDDWSALRLKAV